MSLLSMCDQPDRIRLTERANLREWEIIKLIVIMERKNRHVILLILQPLVIAQLLITKKYRK